MWLLVAILVVALALFAVDVMDGYLNVASTAALVLALPAVWIVVLVIVRMQARRQYRQSAQLRDDQALSFDDVAVVFTSRRGTVRLPVGEVARDLRARFDAEALISDVAGDAGGA